MKTNLVVKYPSAQTICRFFVWAMGFSMVFRVWIAPVCLLAALGLEFSEYHFALRFAAKFQVQMYENAEPTQSAAYLRVFFGMREWAASDRFYCTRRNIFRNGTHRLWFSFCWFIFVWRHRQICAFYHFLGATSTRALFAAAAARVACALFRMTVLGKTVVQKAICTPDGLTHFRFGFIVLVVAHLWVTSTVIALIRRRFVWLFFVYF